MKSKIKELRKRIEEKSVTASIETADGPEELEFPLLTIGDWANIKDKTGVDVWSMLLDTSSEMDPAKTSKMSEEEIASLQRKISIDLLKTVGQDAQIAMFHCSLKKVDPDATEDDADYVITYGLNQAEYMRVVNFLLYGISSKQQDENELKKELENLESGGDTPTTKGK